MPWNFVIDFLTHNAGLINRDIFHIGGVIITLGMVKYKKQLIR